MAIFSSSAISKRNRMAAFLPVILLLSMVFMSQAANAMGDEHRKGKRGERPKPPTFASLDVNQDGVVSFNEFEQHEIPRGDHATIFDFIDTNQDGQITEEELTSHKPPKHRKGKPREQQAYSSGANQ